MNEHTPGPWDVHEISYPSGRDCSIEILAATDGSFIVQTLMRDVMEESDRIKVDLANAWLIAAAPDLLEACREVVRLIEHPQSTVTMPRTHKMLTAAIAKAEGRDV